MFCRNDFQTVGCIGLLQDGVPVIALRPFIPGRNHLINAKHYIVVVLSGESLPQEFQQRRVEITKRHTRRKGAKASE